MKRAAAVLALLLALAAPAGAQTLKRVREEFAKVGEKSIPATVIVYAPDRIKEMSRLPPSSGFIVHPDGYVLSDADATYKGNKKGPDGKFTKEKIHGVDAVVRLPAPDLRTFTARVIRRDADTDSCLLKITDEFKGKLPYLPLGVSNNLHVGAFGMVVGNAFGMGTESEPAMTLGVVSALLDRKEETGGAYDRIYTSAAVNQGNNGGPFVNSLGRAVGIVSSYETDPKSPYRPLGFVTPIDRIRPAYEDLDVYEKIFPPMTKRPLRSDDAAVLEEAFEILTKHVRP
ncbi:MAG: S1C family serine protease, partial [Planctomycetota bacterium]